MTQRGKFSKFLKLNKNKKGFSLIELLCAVAIIAIITPVLVNGFVYATKLNYRTRLQQRADAAANDIYEGIASVKFEELEDYLSEMNGWTALEDDTGKELEYYVSKYYDDLEDCEVKVAIQKYSEAYIVPDLNLVGVQSQYLTLASEINAFDGIVAEKLEQAIKADETIKFAVKQDIIKKINEKHGVVLTSDQIDGQKILIDCGNIDVDKISKETDITLDIAGSDISPEFIAKYETKYRYPANVPNPSVDSTASLKIPYSYAYEFNGNWNSVSDSSLDIQEVLREYYNNPSYKYQFYMAGASDSVSIDAEKEGESVVPQSIFVYYNSLSKMDWINIKNDSSYLHRMFFIEQTQNDDEFLKLDHIVTNSENNFYFGSIHKTDENVTFYQNAKGVTVYSNNPNISLDGIPDTIYESTEKEAHMYRVQVNVTYQSNIFAEISGNFQAGGGTVNQYVGS